VPGATKKSAARGSPLCRHRFRLQPHLLSACKLLNVKPSLHQFVIHPNGLIAYGMFSWSQVDGSSNTEYAGDAVLFKINPKTGMLTNTTKNVMNFGLNEYYSTSLLSMTNKGAKLYFAQLYPSN
jgi:hypothetical protein